MCVEFGLVGVKSESLDDDDESSSALGGWMDSLGARSIVSRFANAPKSVRIILSGLLVFVHESVVVEFECNISSSSSRLW